MTYPLIGNYGVCKEDCESRRPWPDGFIAVSYTHLDVYKRQLMGMRKLKKEGKLQDMEESDEINACSVIVPVEMDYGDGPVTEEWLIFFKNETHNHPTEIEPFGGAATCLGGAIRDPLSGRGLSLIHI